MSVFITLLAALFVFSAVIAIHEFGHFTVAKLCGIQVNEFSIGMGPALWKKIYKGTQYSLRALPVGGYVALEGEESPESQQAEAARDKQEAEDENPVPPEQRTGIPLNEAPVWQRVLVMVAGAFMNFVLGFVVLVILVAAQEGAITSKTIYSIENDALCGQTGLLCNAALAAALSALPKQTQEVILRYYFLRQPQRVIGVQIGRSRSTAGRHIQLALQRLREEMEVCRYE